MAWSHPTLARANIGKRYTPVERVNRGLLTRVEGHSRTAVANAAAANKKCTAINAFNIWTFKFEFNFVLVSGCSSDFEEVGGECVMWLGKRGKYYQAKDLCQQKNATVLMVKSEKFSNALMAWSRPNKA